MQSEDREGVRSLQLPGSRSSVNWWSHALDDLPNILLFLLNCSQVATRQIFREVVYTATEKE